MGDWKRFVLWGGFAVFLAGCGGQGNSTLNQSPTGGFRSGGNATAGERSSPTGAVRPLKALAATGAVTSEMEDTAVWAHPVDPERSLILGTDRADGSGGLYVWNLSGEEVQAVSGIEQAGQVDVEYGFELDGKTVDLAVVAEPKKSRLRVFAIERASGQLKDVTGTTEVFGGAEGDAKVPEAVGLYQRAGDGAVFAIVSPKSGVGDEALAQYRLVANGEKVDVEAVRRFGSLKTDGASVLVDDELGFVYVADKGAGIRKYHVDPDAEGAGKEIAVFGRLKADGGRQGMALIARPGGEGYLVSVDPGDGESVLKFYNRKERSGGEAHRVLGEAKVPSDRAEGVAASVQAGTLVTTNKRGRNSVVFSLVDVLRAAGLP